MAQLKFLAFALCFLTLSAHAAGTGGHSRLDGSVEGGAATFNGVSTNDFKMGNGSFFSLSAEKPFGNLPLFLVVGLNYDHSTGTLNYNYASTVTYIANNINYALDNFTASLGLRLKFFENYPLHPYLEAGGNGGYFQLSYDKTLQTAAVLAAGTDYKTTEGVLEFGGYGEGGLEFDLTNTFGLRAAYRFISNTSNSLTTVKKQQLNYTAAVIYGGIFARF